MSRTVGAIGRWTAAFVLLALWGWPAWGGLLLDEAFDTPAAETYPGRLVDTADGRGWRSNLLGEDEARADYLKFSAPSYLRPEAGTIEIELVRDNQAGAEAVFALVDRAGTPLVVATIYWNGFSQRRVPELQFGGEGREGPLWYVDLSDPVKHGGARATAESIPFPKAVRLGQRFQLAFTWGSRADDCNLYLDGVRFKALKDLPFGLGTSIRRAVWLVIGGEPIKGTPGAGNQLHSLVRRVRLHDQALDAGALRNPDLTIASVAAESPRYGAGQQIHVVLRGAADKRATFSVAGVADGVPMEEVDDGVYAGTATVPPGVNLERAALTGRLADPAGGSAAVLAGPPLLIDTEAPDAPPRALADAAWAGELRVGWTASPSADVAHHLVYRGEGRAPDVSGSPLAEVKGLSFVDNRVVAGLGYRYAVVAVDRAGNRSPATEAATVTALEGEGPRITRITVEPFGKPLKPGQVVTVTLSGQGDGVASVDLGGLARGIALTEQGRTGRYLGSYVVRDADVGPVKTAHRVVARLADAFGSTSELAGPEVPVVGLDTLNDTTPPVIAKAYHDGARVAGFSGKLVAGDVLTVTLEGEPAGYASFALPGVTTGVAMEEVKPGVYTGVYTVGWTDEGTGIGVVAKLADEAGNETTAPAGATVSFDTRVRLSVTASDALLPADRRSKTRLTARAVDANGGEVSGHELALTLSTTEEYTGVVGGGRVEDREARKDDEDNVEVRWGGVTDAFGEMTATYTAGFAAKTALIVAKDLTTGDVGAGWLNTYVASTVAIELLPRSQRGAPDRARLRLTADPTWLTADGRSTSRLKAVLTDLAGNPLAGQRVAFTLGNGNGRLRSLRGGVTDDQGLAGAEYRAGTLAGEVTVTAAAAEWGVTAAVQIELRADAPAKVDLVTSAERVVTGDKATLTVRVSDIHDNPNRAVPVTFTVLQGSGSVTPPALLTDRYGEGRTLFTAGNKGGVAIIEARHTSRAPTEEELRRVYGTLFVPRLFERQDRDRLRVTEWLVKPGDEVAKGQALTTLESRQGVWTVTAPAKGVFVRRVKHDRDRVELGDTLGYVEVDPVVWKRDYP